MSPYENLTHSPVAKDHKQKGDTRRQPKIILPHRPHIFQSKTWHISGGSKESLTTDELNPKLPKSPRQNGRVKLFFSKKPKESLPGEDDSGFEFRCQGEKGTGMIVEDGKTSYRELNSLQPVSINTPSAISSGPKHKTGQIHRRVSTRRARVTYKPITPKGHSTSRDSSTSRQIATSSSSSLVKPRSPYANASAASSFLEPRSMRSVYEQRERENDGWRTGSFSSSSDIEEQYRGRDRNNQERNRSRYPVRYSEESQKDKIGSTSHASKTLANNTSSHQNYHQSEQRKKLCPGNHARNDGRFEYHEERDYASYSSSQELNIPPTRAVYTISSAQRVPATKKRGNKNKPLPELPNDAYKSHHPHYDYHEQTISRCGENQNLETGTRRQKCYEKYERAHHGEW